jgi:hypothetical protein
MSRTVPAAILTALGQPSVQPFYAIELLFDDNSGATYDDAGYIGDRALRFWTGYGDRTIQAETYTGAGNLINIGGLDEVADMSAKNATATLNGVPAPLISLALQENYQHRKCRILFGVTDVDDAVEVFSGFIDELTIEDSAETGTISINIESKWVRLDRPNIRRYTSESQKTRYPSDTFFDWVTDMQDKEVVWGRKSA